MNYSTAELWFIIIGLGVGSFALRFSFLGLVGDRELPEWIKRHLRYTAVGIIPGLVAPLVLFPEATGGAIDPARLIAAVATFVIGYVWKGALAAIICGAATLYLMTWILG